MKVQNQGAPGLWPKCKKGKHWAKECRSKFDDDYNTLPSNNNNSSQQHGTGLRSPPQVPQN